MRPDAPAILLFVVVLLLPCFFRESEEINSRVSNQRYSLEPNFFTSWWINILKRCLGISLEASTKVLRMLTLISRTLVWPPLSRQAKKIVKSKYCKYIKKIVKSKYYLEEYEVPKHQWLCKRCQNLTGIPLVRNEYQQM